MYGKMTGGALRKLAQIVGDGDLFTSPDALEPYSHDEVAELRHLPEAAVRVTSAEQVSRILALAREEGFPVTPRGAGQGLSGGAVPAHGGLVLSLERMN